MHLQEKAGQFRSTPSRLPPPGCAGLHRTAHPGTPGNPPAPGAPAGRGPGRPGPGGDALGQAQRQQAAEATAQTTLEERLAQTQAELENTAAALAQVREEKAALEEKLRALEPEAASWQRLRDTAGDIEVAAHERAQVTLQAARDQAAEIRAQGTRWAQDLQARCLGLQEDLHAAVTNAERELDGARAAFSQAEDHMAQVREALRGSSSN